MRVRAMTADGDMTFGRGAADYYRDQPEAVAQIALTRLRLYLGEWFLDTRDGTPWNTQVLGKRTGGTRDAVIRSRLLGTPGVTGLLAYNSTLDRQPRAFSIAASLQTSFGTASVAGAVDISVQDGR